MLGLAKLQRYNFVRVYGNFINGEFAPSKASKFFEIRNPVTQELVAKAPQSTNEEFEDAVAKAKQAFEKWSRIPILSISFQIYFSSPTVYV